MVQQEERERGIYRKLYIQEGKEAKPGEQGGEGSLTEETTEVSREWDAQGHAILQGTHTPVQFSYLINYNSVTFSVNLSIWNVCTGMFHLHQWSTMCNAEDT